MKIAVSTNLFPPVISGTSSYSHDIAVALADFGHTVYLVMPSRIAVARPEVKGVCTEQILQIASWKVPSTSIMLGFNQLRSTLVPKNTAVVTSFLREHHVDVVYQQSHVFDTAVHTRAACDRLGIPRAVAHHTNISHPNWMLNKCLRWGERTVVGSAFLRRQDLWVCLDEFTMQYCAERFPHMRRTKVMYGVAPFPDCLSEPVIDEARALRHRHYPLILSLGHVTSCRDRVDLIHAVSGLRKRYPDIGLVIIGDLQVSYPVAEAQKLNLQDHVFFLGKRPRSTIRAFLDAVDIEAHWYYDESTFGVATLECMASGACCLAACPQECYGSDLFSDGVHYIRVKSNNPTDIADKISHLSEDPSLRKQVAQQAAELVRERFSWRSVASELTRVLGSLTGGHSA